MVGIDADTVGAHVGNVIRPGAGVSTRAGDVDAVLGVGAAVPVHGVFHRQQVAFFVAAHLQLDHQALADEVGIELFFAGQAQLDRDAFELGRCRDRNGFHGHACFTAESAADQRGNHAEIALGKCSVLAIKARWAKGDWVDAHSVTWPFSGDLGDGHMRLNGHVLDVRNAEGVFHNGGALRPGRFGVAFADFEMVGDVGARLPGR